VRAGAGAHFLVPIRSHVPWKEIPALLPLGSRICLTDAHATGTFWDADLDGPVAIIVSNEARGPSTEARRSATDAVRIPLLAGESLNAAVAGSLVLYEVLRQRTTAGRKPGTADRNSGASERRVVQGTRA
jgi:tRNA G18 (ribose-2'-O)-methylase SpoU